MTQDRRALFDSLVEQIEAEHAQKREGLVLLFPEYAQEVEVPAERLIEKYSKKRGRKKKEKDLGGGGGA